MPTIDDVAKLAGVSTATVSRVVNKNGNVTGKTGQRVLSAMQELNYYPNKFARGLAAKQADGLGVVIQDFADPYFGMVLRGIEKVAKTHNLQITVASANRSAKDELKAIEFLRQQSYNVIILTTSLLSDEELLKCSDQNLKLINMGHLYSAFQNDCIYLDDIEGGTLATNYLIEQGHSKIAHISFPMFYGALPERSLGYHLALEKAKLSHSDELFIQSADFGQLSALQATQELLKRAKPFTALFASTDIMAMGAHKALRQAGLKIPDDISIVGYDDIDTASFLYPALTTIRQPIQEMGMAAAHLAISYLKGQIDQEEVVRKFSPQLVIRESVKNLN